MGIPPPPPGVLGCEKEPPPPHEATWGPSQTKTVPPHNAGGEGGGRDRDVLAPEAAEGPAATEGVLVADVHRRGREGDEAQVRRREQVRDPVHGAGAAKPVGGDVHAQLPDLRVCGTGGGGAQGHGRSIGTLNHGARARTPAEVGLIGMALCGSQGMEALAIGWKSAGIGPFMSALFLRLTFFAFVH